MSSSKQKYSHIGIIFFLSVLVCVSALGYFSVLSAVQYWGLLVLIYVITFIALTIRSKGKRSNGGGATNPGGEIAVYALVFPVVSYVYFYDLNFIINVLLAILMYFAGVVLVIFLAVASPQAPLIREEKLEQPESASAVIEEIATAEFYSLIKKTMASEALYETEKMRVNDYTLEGSLLGALSFTAFIALAASDKNIFAPFPKMSIAQNQSGLLSVESMYKYSLALLDKHAVIYELLSVLSIAASAAFILILISRVGFIRILNESAKHKSYERELLNMLIFNSQMSNFFSATSVEQKKYDIKIELESQQETTDRSIMELNKYVAIMKILRSIGVMIFFALLLVSSFLVSHALTAAMIIGYLAPSVYLSGKAKKAALFINAKFMGRSSD